MMDLRRVLLGGRVVSTALSVGALLGAPGLPAPWGTFPLPGAGPAWGQTHLVPSDTLDLSGLQEQFQAIARRAASGVVAISATLDSVDSDDLLSADQLNPEKLNSALQKTTRLVGTGCVIDPDGYILTNEHVVADAAQLWITTDDHRVYPAFVVASDPLNDLAVLKAPAHSLTPVRFGDGSAVARGQWTLAIGNPYGLAAEGEMAVSVGIVSATGRSLPRLAHQENRLYSHLIQTTAEINPGNSGGPLLDLKGSVIGINTAVVLPRSSTNGIGFAMPVTPELLRLVQRLKAGEPIVHGYLGASVVSTTGFDRRRLGIDEPIGVRVVSIESGSPASTALQAGDVIVSVDDEPVRDSDRFVRQIGSLTVGQTVRVGLFRSGRRQGVEVVIAGRAQAHAAVSRENQRLRWRGMLLGPVPAHWSDAERPQGEGGVLVIAIDPDSPMRHHGVTAGAVLTSVAGHPVNGIDALQRVINQTLPDQWTVGIGGGASAMVSAGE